MRERSKLTLRDATARTNSPPVDPSGQLRFQGRSRGWGISASRLDKLHEYARQMRRNPTEAEQRLWARLSGSQLGGFKFRRQQVVGSAIVDFACPARWLVVEVDGDTHDNPAIEALRDKKLTDVGIRVLRFTNDEVMQNIEGVLQTIMAELQKPFDRKRAAARPHPNPSPGSEADPKGQREGPKKDNDAQD